MPWQMESQMDHKRRFIASYLRDRKTFSDLCSEYGISRKTGYKWIQRFHDKGPDGLEDRSRRSDTHPNQTPSKVENALLQVRGRHPSWGPKKLLASVEKKHPDWALPHPSTVCDLLNRHNLIAPQRARRRLGHPGAPSMVLGAPNALWSADFKGQFRMGNGQYCYPLTITDNFSRYLFACKALPSVCIDDAKREFTRVFKEFGLPDRIRSDNGVPFASTSLARLSQLSAWWVRLQILPDLIQPGKPQQNGKHERMHRTLKQETTRPPAHALSPQQRKFNIFIDEFNNDRPHEALEMRSPADVYQRSNREMPDKILPLEYPDRFEVRYVSANGGIRWNNDWINVSTVCSGDLVGLEEVEDGIWHVYYGILKIGKLDERHKRIEDLWGQLVRR